MTPDAVGTVTVEIAAGAAENDDGNGNTAAPLFSLGIPYDDDSDRAISKREAIASINDYLFGEQGAITRSQVIHLISLYLFGPPPGPGTAASPGAPTGLTAAANGQTQIDLSWNGPSDDGGAAITGYRIEVSADRLAWSDLVGDSGSTSTTHSHTGLTAGSTRHYRVSAINSACAGRVSAIATGTTASAPPAGSPATDRAALVALYNATGGADWTDNINWLSDGPLDDWYGVNTDANGRVTTVDLSGNQLTGSIPAQLGNLSNLERLSLTGNQLSATPAQLGNLSNLKSLDLSDNQLTGSIPAQLGNLSNLERLDLSFNQLSAIPKELGNLSNLRSLSVSSNQLSGSIPTQLGNLSNLESLSLTGNQLSGAIPAQLGNLSNLESLYLSFNQLSGCIPEGLRDVRSNDLSRLGLPFCGN